MFYVLELCNTQVITGNRAVFSCKGGLQIALTLLLDRTIRPATCVEIGGEQGEKTRFRGWTRGDAVLLVCSLCPDNALFDMVAILGPAVVRGGL